MLKYLLNKKYIVLISEWAPIKEYGRTHKWLRIVRYPCKPLSKNAWGNFIAFDTNEYSHEMVLKFLDTFK